MQGKDNIEKRGPEKKGKVQNPYGYAANKEFNAKSTKVCINKDSKRLENYKEFDNKEKTGSKIDGTHSAHIFSKELALVMESNSRGVGKSRKTWEEVAKALDSKENLRIKTEYGNLKKDRNRDARIAGDIAKGYNI